MHGAILAGGMASRYDGLPKGLETVGGERMLDLVVSAVTAATGSLPLLIANDAQASTWRSDLKVVADVEPGCGSVGGILTALSAADGPVLVVAWDLPFVSPGLLEMLIGGWKSYDAFLPSSPGPLGFEPLCAVYTPPCTQPIRAAIENEDFRTTAFHDDVRVGTLPSDQVAQHGDPNTLFFNVNAPDDLEQAAEIWRELHETPS